MSEIHVDPEAINRYVAERIIESSIGEALRKVIDEEVKKLTTRYAGSSPLSHVVSSKISEMAREVLDQPEYQQQIREAIIAQITPDFISRVAQQVTVKGGF